MSGRRVAPTLTVFCASLAACGGSSSDRAGVAAPTASPNTALIATCPVTIPNGSTPPSEHPSPEFHGNGVLWTALPPDGKIVATRPFVLPDGSMRIKFPWWGSRRAGSDLSITGTSLQPPGGLARAHISPGLTGAPHFWASGVIFPAQGCWRVTASSGRARLSFVVLVSKAAA
jgi:hypothetical protein